jgi:hypothetical protein
VHTCHPISHLKLQRPPKMEMSTLLSFRSF